jgi:surface antigen
MGNASYRVAKTTKAGIIMDRETAPSTIRRKDHLNSSKNYGAIILLSLMLQACSVMGKQDGKNVPIVAHGQLGGKIVPGRKPVFTADREIPQILRTAMASGYYDSQPTQCVPYARKVSGFPIYGNAHTWWAQARLKGYETGNTPQEGSVLVLRKTGKLKLGHVAVVNRILSDREIEVTHSNWGNDTKKRSFIYQSQRVRDDSPKNDWSQLRFWNKYIDTYGGIYPNHGFIYPRQEIASVN